MKKLFIVLILTFSFGMLRSQDTAGLKYQFQKMFDSLDTSGVKTKILIDRTPCFSALNKYDGSFDTTVGSREWRQAYYDLSNSSLDTSAFESLESIDSRMYRYFRNDTIPIGIFNFKYDAFKSHTFDSNLVEFDTNTNLLKDVAGRKESPYETKDFFMISPLSPMKFSDSVPLTFFFSSAFIFTNTGETITQIDVDFDDGAGDRVFYPDDIVHVLYTSPGLKVIQFEVSTSSNRKLRGKIGINLFPIKHEPHAKSFELKADIDYLGVKADGYVTVKRGKIEGTNNYRDNNSCYGGKVVVFLDGVDFGPKECVGGRCGDLGWPDLINPGDDFPELAKMPELIKQLTDNGYDVFFLDNKDGSDFMQRNAMLLVKLLQEIQANQCDCREIVVVGPSMGGQVAKYALSYMEKNGITHNTRLMVAFDSPNTGANIPVGFQYFVRHMGSISADARNAFRNQLQSPAAKQLLVAHMNNSDESCDAFRTQFLNDLAALGTYPQQCRRIAILNGSGIGSALWAEQNTLMLDIDVRLRIKYVPIPVFVAKIIGIPGREINFKSNVVNQFLTTFSSFHHSVDGNFPNLDGSPGGIRRDLRSLRALPNFNVSAVIRQYGIGLKYAVNTDFFSFIPSSSALHTHNPDLFQNIKNNVPSDNALGRSFYHAYYAPDANEDHVQITDANIAWSMAEVLKNETLFEDLPNAKGATYNMATFHQNKVPSIYINNGGKLHINGNYRALYGNAQDPMPESQKHLDFVKAPSNCGNAVVVQNGGVLEVGEAPNPFIAQNRSATVRFVKGTTLEIRTGGTLKIWPGSLVIIEQGAQLIVSEGATIDLEATSATHAGGIEIRGELVLGPACFFKPNGQGFVKFNSPQGEGTHAHNILAQGHDCVFAIESHQWDGLKVGAGTQVYPQDHLNEFRLQNTHVSLEANARLNLGCRTSISYTKIRNEVNTPDRTHQGIIVYGQPGIDIHHNTISNGLFGIRAIQNFGGTATAFHSNKFENCATGLYTYDLSNHIKGNVFLNCNIGWKAEYITTASLAELNHFQGNTIAVQLVQTPGGELVLGGNSFINNFTGLDNDGGRATITCNLFRGNNTGIYGRNGTFQNLSSVVYSSVINPYNHAFVPGGYNKFRQNTRTLMGLHYSGYDLRDGRNFTEAPPAGSGQVIQYFTSWSNGRLSQPTDFNFDQNAWSPLWVSQPGILANNPGLPFFFLHKYANTVAYNRVLGNPIFINQCPVVEWIIDDNFVYDPNNTDPGNPMGGGPGNGAGGYVVKGDVYFGGDKSFADIRERVGSGMFQGELFSDALEQSINDAVDGVNNSGLIVNADGLHKMADILKQDFGGKKNQGTESRFYHQYLGLLAASVAGNEGSSREKSILTAEAVSVVESIQQRTAKDTSLTVEQAGLKNAAFYGDLLSIYRQGGDLSKAADAGERFVTYASSVSESMLREAETFNCFLRTEKRFADKEITREEFADEITKCNVMDTSTVFIPMLDSLYNAAVLKPERLFGLRTEIYPNPVLNDATLLLEFAEPGTAEVSISDQSGSKVMPDFSFVAVNAGMQTADLNTTKLAAGVYCVTVSLNGQSKTLLLIKQ